MPDHLIYFAAGLLAGLIFFVVALVRRGSSASAKEILNERLAARDSQIAETEKSLRESAEQAASLNRQLIEQREARAAAETTAGRVASLEEEIFALRQEKDSLQAAKSELETALAKDRESYEGKLKLLAEAKDALAQQFKVLAAEIFDEKARQFSEQSQVAAKQNEAALGTLLDPLKTQLGDFKKKVEEVYVQEGLERAGLKKQVEMLAALNQAISEDAKNLTSALKGSNKAQGNWGEMILETLLEASGIRKGTGYSVQKQYESEEGKKGKPDVILHLPKDRCLVVDSKVSIDAYGAYVATDDPLEREKALKKHVQSVRDHIDGLHSRDYQKLHGIKSALDFVVMFVPIEPAFLLAISNDDKLFMDAWNKNVLMASPSTLLYVLRIVDYLWRQEDQARNAKDIAYRGAKLYEKFVGFIDDMLSLGKSLADAQKNFSEAKKKLSEGQGNLVAQAEKLRDLGVHPSKPLPAELVVRAAGDAPALPSPAQE